MGKGKQAGEGAPVAGASRRRRARGVERRGDRDPPDPDPHEGVGGVGCGATGSGLGFQGLWDKGVGGLVRPVGPFGLAGRQLGRSPVGGGEGVLCFYFFILSIFLFYFIHLISVL